MSTATIEQPRHRPAAWRRRQSRRPVVALKRRTIDSVLIGFGVVATAAFAVAGGLLTWGNNFASDYVGDELSSQNITFPSPRSPDRRGPHRPGRVRRPAGSTPATRPRPTPASSTATSKGSPTAPPTPTSEPSRAQPRPTSRQPSKPASRRPRSTNCRQRPTASAASATACSRARPSAACCSRPTPGRQSA